LFLPCILRNFCHFGRLSSLFLNDKAFPMNVQKEIKRINEKEQRLGLEAGKSSWHDDYKESPFVYVGGLSYRLNEGDLKVAFSQFGTVNHLNLIRDKKNWQDKRFCIRRLRRPTIHRSCSG